MPTALGEAIASYGRIARTPHVCTLATEEPYRRDINAIRNLQEGRHALAAIARRVRWSIGCRSPLGGAAW
ncbi:Tn3 family transposase [Actinoallomurus sp. NBC_01490]|uniref:Tn3 family transposase n=1 Tax=Actinoallomurus sp. NBC_01490 TaxID=2903557 RepID=UPI003FA41833